MPKIIAFGHRKRTGKDTAGSILQRLLNDMAPQLRVVQVSFAIKLKEVSYEMFKWGGLQPGPFYEQPENAHLREVVLPLLGKTPRQIWIEVGNLMRQVHPEVWIRNAIYVDADVIIVRDLRYHNEADVIDELGGDRYKMVRDSVEKSTDVADCNLDDYSEWTGHIFNNGTLDDLEEKLAYLAQKIVKELANG
jgi:hypothetical protein